VFEFPYLKFVFDAMNLQNVISRKKGENKRKIDEKIRRQNNVMVMASCVPMHSLPCEHCNIQRINGMGAVTTREVYDRIMGQSKSNSYNSGKICQ
jgi:hypothetical protein